MAELPAQEQRTLLEGLQGRLSAARPGATQSTDDLKPWLDELDELRSRTHKGKTGPSLQQIMDELREERF